VRAGRGGEEKVGEFEWSGKDQRIVFFVVKVRGHEKLLPPDVRFLA